ncbi:MAG: membrane protein insertion efficiency factor YidD [Prochloraceae cyanobacterium]
MATYSLDSALTKIATASITGYQKYISPYKGFRCAHRAYYGEDSCSEYIKKAIARKGIVTGTKMARQRFRECSQAYKMLSDRLPNLNNHPTTVSGLGDSCDDVKICCCAFDACPCNGMKIND